MADEASECLFERLRLLQQRTSDSAEVARALSARINSRVTSHDKNIRQSTLEKLWNKQTGALAMLLSLMESSRDMQTAAHIASIFRETLCVKQGKGKSKASNFARQSCLQNLIMINGTQAVIRGILFSHCKRDGNVNTEILLQDLLWSLSAIAPKDPKFASKVRSIGCVRTLHLILKGHFTDNKLVFPLLVIMKQLAKNSVTTSILVRDGIVGTYERVLVSLGFIPTARLRLCVDAIDYFSKNRAGRRALCTKKNVQTLHRFCSQCPDEAEYDGLLARVCSVITLCLKHQVLPVPTTTPNTFNLNHLLKDNNVPWPQLDEDDDAANSDTKSVMSDLDDESQDYEVDEPIDEPEGEYDPNSIKVEPTEDIEKPLTKPCDSLQSSIWIHTNERDLEDLKRYFVFFKEFGSYSKQIRLVKSRSNSKGSILEDLIASQANIHKPLTSSLSFSMSAVYNAELENILGPSQMCLPNLNKNPECASTTSISSSIKIHKDLSKYSSFYSIYSVISSRVRSVIPFVKVAYPDMMGGQSLVNPEPLNKMDRSACRAKLLTCVDRAINPDSYMNDVVYDLDQLCTSNNNVDNLVNKSASADSIVLTNTDEQDISRIQSYCFATKLSFESRFESGNLRKAIQIGPREYELILMPDVNSNKRHQWFYFEVRNMQQGRPYVFNIVNCEKSDSQFNFGMKPVLYSVKEALSGKAGWIRSGSEICYYRNSYRYAHQKNSTKCYLTVTFNIEFPHTNDVCYIAYHYPYTYSMLMGRIWQLSQSLPPTTYFRAETLCYSLNNNEVPLLTISAEDSTSNPIVDREIIFLTARVHPGESNASWVMDGTLGFLLDNGAHGSLLRSKYVFKIVPMLNVEGVINGCHRCGLTNEDLNRRWSKPSPVLHPSVYHTKGLIEYLVRVWKKPPLVYCDYHGHSRKKNVFFYGCAAAESWYANDRLMQDEPVKYLMLPALMHRISPAFALGSCSFRVERERESTARVTVWRHLTVTRSYTMEASFCGFDTGPFKGFHLNTRHLENVGSDFCEALTSLSDSNTNMDLQLTKDLNGNIVEINIKGSRLNRELAMDSEGGSIADSFLRSDSDEDFD